MSDNNTVARPYAKAIFDLALNHQQMPEWSVSLAYLTRIVHDPLALKFIRNPSTTPEEQSELLFSVADDVVPKSLQLFVLNLLQLLAHNKRLPVLPSIFLQYEALRADHDKTLVVEVVSFASLTKDQETRLIERLSKRLERSVSLNVSIDKSLRGGAIIRAGHLVFDASVETQIKKLGASLAA